MRHGVMGSSVLLASLSLTSTVAAGSAGGLARADVCASLPAAEVVRTVGGGRLLEATPFRAPDGKLARCSYAVVPAGTAGEKPVLWMVELLPAGQFEALRPFIGQPVREIAGIGDGAFVYKEGESGRSRLYVRRRKRETLSLSGPDEAVLRKIALLALSRL